MPVEHRWQFWSPGASWLTQSRWTLWPDTLSAVMMAASAPELTSRISCAPARVGPLV